MSGLFVVFVFLQMLIVIMPLICILISFFNSKPGSKPKSCTLPQKMLAWLTTTKSRFTLSVPPRLGWDGCITPKGHTDALKNAELSLSCDFISTERLQTWSASTRCTFPELKIDVREEFFGLFFFLPHKDISLFYILFTAVLRSLCCWVASESRPQHWLWED